jgi:hypothetical protein
MKLLFDHNLSPRLVNLLIERAAMEEEDQGESREGLTAPFTGRERRGADDQHCRLLL